MLLSHLFPSILAVALLWLLSLLDLGSGYFGLLQILYGLGPVSSAAITASDSQALPPVFDHDRCRVF